MSNIYITHPNIIGGGYIEQDSLSVWIALGWTQTTPPTSNIPIITSVTLNGNPGNGQSVVFDNSSGYFRPGNPLSGGSILTDGGSHIFTRTTDPGGAAQDGDVWLAPIS